jgi:hypothetical protein
VCDCALISARDQKTPSVSRVSAATSASGRRKVRFAAAVDVREFVPTIEEQAAAATAVVAVSAQGGEGGEGGGESLLDVTSFSRAQLKTIGVRKVARYNQLHATYAVVPRSLWDLIVFDSNRIVLFLVVMIVAEPQRFNVRFFLIYLFVWFLYFNFVLILIYIFQSDTWL